MPRVRSLQSPTVFAVNCDVDETEIRVALLAVDPDEYQPGIATLIDLDKESEGVLAAYPVILPRLTHTPIYKAILKRCLPKENN